MGSTYESSKSSCKSTMFTEFHGSDRFSEIYLPKERCQRGRGLLLDALANTDSSSDAIPYNAHDLAGKLYSCPCC